MRGAMRSFQHLPAAGALALTMTACAALPPNDAGFSDVAAQVEARTGAEPVWGRDAEGRAEIARAREALLSERLDLDGAVALALVNSPRLQAEMETLGVARAEFLSAALPPNPFIEIRRTEATDALGVEASLPLLDLIFWPWRARSGEAGFEAAKAQAAATLADAAAEVRLAYADHVAARQRLGLYEQAEQAGRASEAAARALYEAGNIARVEYDMQRQFAAQMIAERMRAESRIGPSRERLTALLGLSEADAERLETLSRLPGPSADGLEADAAAERAARDSLQIDAAEAELRALAARRGISNVEALIGEVEALAEFEREDGDWTETYGVGFALPLDLGLTGRARTSAELRASAGRLAQARIDALADARAAAQTLESTRALAAFQQQVGLPVSADVFEGVTRDYNAMQTGVLELLRARRDRVEAGEAYVEAVADYWRARAELERHVRFADVAQDRPPSLPEAMPEPGAPLETDADRAQDADTDHSQHQHEGHSR